jgi:hypothetical protein
MLQTMGIRVVRTCFVFIVLPLISAAPASAQGGDLTLFIGRAYPVYDERLTLRPSAPSLPGADITVTGTPELSAAGGLVAGAALAFELGVLGIEGRLDSTGIGFDVTGARYELRASAPPFQGLTGVVVIGDGRLDADRLNLLSLNARLRTPGPVGLVASGGFSYLPDISITGSVPLSAQIVGLPVFSSLDAPLRLRAAPGESNHRFGLNGGAGLRIGGRRVALMAEVRAFYFREYELRFGVDGAPALVTDLLEGLAPVRFEPVIVNAQAGIVLRF